MPRSPAQHNDNHNNRALFAVDQAARVFSTSHETRIRYLADIWSEIDKISALEETNKKRRPLNLAIYNQKRGGRLARLIFGLLAYL